MKSLRNKESVTRCTSQEKLSNLINQYESQLDKTKKLKKLLVNKSKKIQFPWVNQRPRYRFYDENYINNAVKSFRTEKKAFLYSKGTFISGLPSKLY